MSTEPAPPIYDAAISTSNDVRVVAIELVAMLLASVANELAALRSVLTPAEPAAREPRTLAEAAQQALDRLNADELNRKVDACDKQRDADSPATNVALNSIRSDMAALDLAEQRLYEKVENYHELDNKRFTGIDDRLDVHVSWKQEVNGRIETLIGHMGHVNNRIDAIEVSRKKEKKHAPGTGVVSSKPAENQNASSEETPAHRAVQRLLFALHIYSGYPVNSRGPMGCLFEAIKELEPHTAAKISDGVEAGTLLDPDPMDATEP